MKKYNTEKEVWKDIKGYEGYYQVSNLGRIRSVDRVVESQYRSSQLVKGNIKKVNVGKNGYKRVQLYKNNKRDGNLVHRLVAEAFILNPNNYPIINHKDENPSNNKVENLEWCDYRYNLTYGTKIQKTLESEGYKRRTNKIKKPIYVINKDGKKKRYESITSACQELDLNHCNVSACLNNRNNNKRNYKTHRGYTFEYA